MLTRREFIQTTTAASIGCLSLGADGAQASSGKVRKPNLLYIFSDQWRYFDHGYAGNTEVTTPNIDRFAGESVNFKHAVSGIPVCCPHRASLITGKYPLTHGLFLNDLSLAGNHKSIAHCFNEAGYKTGWIGKWHLDGQGRDAFTPPERRQGFQYWRALECTHHYNHSAYYGDTEEKKYWEGYDAISQTQEAVRYLERHVESGIEDPFSLFLSWGPPHAPYHTAPEDYREQFASKEITLRENVPEAMQEIADKDYRGYYAHMAALDSCFGELLTALDKAGLTENTIVVYTSDHGDMLYSQGGRKKQQPWDESLRVPFLLRWPERLGKEPREITMPLDTPDIMPTLLGLADIHVPEAVEGVDRSGVVTGTEAPDDDHAALITCPSPFGQWDRSFGGREYRGIRTARYTYCRDLKGPWLFYDNEADPFQMNNLVNDPQHADLRERLNERLNTKLKETGDAFLPGPELIKRCGYVVDPGNETIDYKAPFNPANITRSPL